MDHNPLYIEKKLTNNSILAWISVLFSLVALILALVQKNENENFREYINSAMTSVSSSAQQASIAANQAEISGQNAITAANTTVASAAQANTDLERAEREKRAAQKAAINAANSATLAANAAVSAETSEKKIRALTLPDGAELKVDQGSAVEGMYNILNDPNSELTQALHVGGLNFETDSARITPDSAYIIDQFVALLKAYPSSTIRIEGHTDSTGDAAHNLILSSDRAAAVKSELEKKGIAGARIDTQGFGQDHPIASNETYEGQMQNRRVDVIVLKR
jgi:outer membrane protein OmpA-like peptidoglycan-associated protein